MPLRSLRKPPTLRQQFCLVYRVTTPLSHFQREVAPPELLRLRLLSNTHQRSRLRPWFRPPRCHQPRRPPPTSIFMFIILAHMPSRHQLATPATLPLTRPGKSWLVPLWRRMYIHPMGFLTPTITDQINPWNPGPTYVLCAAARLLRRSQHPCRTLVPLIRPVPGSSTTRRRLCLR